MLCYVPTWVQSWLYGILCKNGWRALLLLPIIMCNVNFINPSYNEEVHIYVSAVNVCTYIYIYSSVITQPCSHPVEYWKTWKKIYIISLLGNHIDWWRVHKIEFNSVSIPSTCCFFFFLTWVFCIYLIINFPIYLRVVTVCFAIDKRWMQIEKSVDGQVKYII